MQEALGQGQAILPKYPAPGFHNISPEAEVDDTVGQDGARKLFLADHEETLENPDNNALHYPVVLKTEEYRHCQERIPGKAPHGHGTGILFDKITHEKGLTPEFRPTWSRYPSGATQRTSTSSPHETAVSTSRKERPLKMSSAYACRQTQSRPPTRMVFVT